MNRSRNAQRECSYFDNDDDDYDEVGFTSNAQAPAQGGAGDDEIDPLDAFMAGVDAQIQVEATKVGQTQLADIVSDGFNDGDYGAETSRSKGKGGAAGADSDDEYDYGDDGGAAGATKKMVEGLPFFDHSSIAYAPFRRRFYDNAHELDESAAMDVRKTLEVSVMGQNVPNPVQSLEALGLPAPLMKEIQRAGYTAPTSIQAQALPVALSGRDLIGLAKTGSGKTVTYLWPMIVHILAQPQMKAGDGPIGVILSPTRELAVQIYQECKKFAEKSFSIRTLCIYGGASKWEMQKALKEEAPEIVVATPGRLIDLVRRKSTNLHRCTMVVLDEADRMFDMGFEYQMRSIVANIRPDAQKFMFSATMKKPIERFALEMLNEPIRIVVGTIGMANPDIQQVVHIVSSEEDKWAWLASQADDFIAEGKVLIFVNTRVDTEEVSKKIKLHFAQRQLLVGVECLHGDKDQSDRDSAMRRFGKADGEVSILVATDVASRGLHVSDIRTVINYDVPSNIETYVHRIGRTGRMGKDGVNPGTAFILFNTKTNRGFAEPLVRNLNLSKQVVPSELLKLVQSSVGGGGGGRGWGRGGGPGNGGGMGSHGSQKRGLGFGGGSQVAQTSAMAAEQGPQPPQKKPNRWERSCVPGIG